MKKPINEKMLGK